MRNLMFVALAATGLIAANGCCGSAFRVCDGPCGGGNDPCTWYPGKCLFEKAGCNSGCGKYYWSDWHSEPPDCCDPCDRCGNYAGRYYEGNCGGCGTCGGGCDGGGDFGGWTGGYTGGRSAGGGCNCGGGGGGMMPGAEGDVIYETGAMRPRMSPTPITPVPAAGPTRATATRPRPSQASAPRMRPTQPIQASAPRVRYNGTTTTARQQDQRRVRPASHVTAANTTTSNTSWEESQAVRQATTAPAERPCTSCRR